MENLQPTAVDATTLNECTSVQANYLAHACWQHTEPIKMTG